VNNVEGRLKVKDGDKLLFELGLEQARTLIEKRERLLKLLIVTLVRGENK